MPLARRFAAVAVAALAFCAAAAAAGGDPQYQPAAVDQGWTDSIVLGTKDLGAGWRSSGSSGSMDGSDGSSATCSMPDESDLVLTGGSYSPDFLREDGAFVSSSAMVWQTPEQAQADWDRSMQPAIMGCFAAAMQGLSTKQIRVVVTGRKQLPTPGIAARSAAYRLSLVLKATVKVHKKRRTISVPATSDFVAVGTGRATAMLWVFSFNAHPLSDFNRQQYALLMVRRMTVDPAPATN